MKDAKVMESINNSTEHVIVASSWVKAKQAAFLVDSRQWIYNLLMKVFDEQQIASLELLHEDNKYLIIYPHTSVEREFVLKELFKQDKYSILNLKRLNFTEKY